MSAPASTATLLENLRGLSVEEIEKDATTRKKAWNLTKALTMQLQDPLNVAAELIFATYIPMSVRIAVDLNLFSLVAEHDKPTTPKELAAKSGGDPDLVFRLLRLLASVGFFHEAGEELYSSSSITKAMANPAVQCGHRVGWDVLVNAAAKTPKYFRETNHRTGTDPKDGLIQYGHETKLDFFQWLATKPSITQDYNVFMGQTEGSRKFWIDWYPVKESLLEGYKSDTALLVDVGGGKGHDLDLFHEKYPNSGRLVLEDFPHVVEVPKAKNPIFECIGHDFFAEQPVKGARAYLLHHILHNFSDETSLEILKPLKAAMKPGYSKVLIHDLVLPNQGASAYQCTMDFAMMTTNWGKERSERQWHTLLERAGFKNIKTLTPDTDADGIIEGMV